MSRSLLETATAIAQAAGALLARRFDAGVGTVETKSHFDVVTAVDREVEARIVADLRTAFPSHAVVGEEGGAHGSTASGYRWYVDPLDGTKNFARGNPTFALSLALTCSDELVAGLVLDPMRGELFAAERGAGAFRNGAPIHASTVASLEQCLVTTGFPSATRHRGATLDPLSRISMTTQGVRRTGSSALDLSYVACGRVDAFWDIGLKPWDVAAGVLIVAEAGGRCSHLSGDPFTLAGPDLLASGAGVHDAFVQLFDAHPSLTGR